MPFLISKGLLKGISLPMKDLSLHLSKKPWMLATFSAKIAGHLTAAGSCGGGPWLSCGCPWMACCGPWLLLKLILAETGIGRAATGLGSEMPFLGEAFRMCGGT